MNQTATENCILQNVTVGQHTQHTASDEHKNFALSRQSGAASSTWNHVLDEVDLMGVCGVTNVHRTNAPNGMQLIVVAVQTGATMARIVRAGRRTGREDG